VFVSGRGLYRRSGKRAPYSKQNFFNGQRRRSRAKKSLGLNAASDVQCFFQGDICAGTAVVQQEFGLGIKAVAVLLWATILVGAAWAVPHICAESHAANGPRYLNQIVVQVGQDEESAYLRVARFTINIQLASDRQP
jgi:hypothetical protein